MAGSCFSGAGGRSVLAPGTSSAGARRGREAADPRGACCPASSGAEISGPAADGSGGLFLEVRLIEAIGSGQGDINGDGQISLKELAAVDRARVKREAKKANREQTPHLTLGKKLSCGRRVHRRPGVLAMSRAALLTVAAHGACPSGHVRSKASSPRQGRQRRAEKIGGFSSDTHFLLGPTGDAESLLGRQVRVTSAGAWTIADERAPAAKVRVKESSSSYKKKYRVGLGDLTAFAGSYKDMLQARGPPRRSVEAEYEIQNVKTLTADTEGSRAAR